LHLMKIFRNWSRRWRKRRREVKMQKNIKLS